MALRMLSDLDSGPSLHTIYAYLTGLLLALVEIKYEGSKTGPFEQHHTLMILFLIAISVYVMALLVLRSYQVSLIMVWICHISGSVACELLMLVLVSPLWSFVINVSSLVLVLALLFCYNYIFPLSHPVDSQSDQEAHVTEMIDLEAAIIPDP